jgi:demethylmenaquinone methyltransferase/2-methoxy-6-polyprenyl-1,4-benzoquinol methylase
VDRNRIKFFFAGPLLDAVNPRIPGRPHHQLSRLVPDDPDVVLDLCSGTGYVARLVAAAHPSASILALDVSPEMLEVGRRRALAEGLGGIRFVHGDAAELPLADASVDVVTAAFALHELPRPVRERSVEEVRRVLKPRGRLLCMDLDQRQPPSKLVDFYIRAFETVDARDVLGTGLVQQLTDFGFTIAEHRSHQGRLPAYQLIDARRPG